MTDLLSAVAIMFIVAGPFLLFANRYDLPAVPLLIVAGIVAGFFIGEPLALELARFGIALLVFSFGIEIELSVIRPVLEDSEVAAVGQILVVGTLGVGFGILFGVPAGEAIYLGAAVALSSTIVATSLLREEIRMDLVYGRLSQTIHFVQDVLAILFVLVIGAEVLAPDPIVTQIGYGVLLVVAAIFINQYLFDLFRRVTGNSDELMIVGVISLLVLFIGASEVTGVSIVVGAFAAGLAVPYDPGEYLGLLNGIESIRDFFVAVFFTTIGALVVLPFVQMPAAESVEKLALVAGLVLLTAIVKPAVTTGILLYKGYEARTATLTGLNTDQVSEFSLIIAIEALLLGFLTPAVFDVIIFAAAVTMITSAFTRRHSELIYRTLADRGLSAVSHDKIDELSDVPEDISDHIVVVGYGRKGSRMVEICEELDVPYVVIENDPSQWDALRLECDSYIFGDAMEPYTWSKANVDEANVIISAADSETVSRRLLEQDFDATLVLRAQDEKTALELLDGGATYVTVPDLLASEQLIEHVEAVLAGDVPREGLRSRGLAELERYKSES